MNTWNYLTDPALRSLFWPPLVAGLSIALFGGALSIFVVLKRMAFIGQGISHAAFGGIGVAYVLGLGGAASPAGYAGQLGIVFVFCLLAAMQVGFLTSDRATRAGRGGTQSDTAIGIVLVASMALGSLLLHQAERLGRAPTVSWESLLFGSIVSVTWNDAWASLLVACVVLGAIIAVRRPLMFWAFDEHAAAGFGVPVQRLRLMLLILLALATVTAMRLAGVVLATAMLVLPAAAAVQFARDARGAAVLTMVFAVVGVLAGVVLSFEFDVPTGASIVLTLATIFGVGWTRARLSRG